MFGFLGGEILLRIDGHRTDAVNINAADVFPPSIYILIDAYCQAAIFVRVNLVEIYQCLCDETRLRILNLLSQRPLCVCHLQEIMGRTQAQVSQHLARMKKDGLVEAHRHHNWMIYSLPRKVPQVLEAHLKCLQDCLQSEPIFRKDLAALKKIQTECDWINEVVEVKASDCCG